MHSRVKTRKEVGIAELIRVGTAQNLRLLPDVWSSQPTDPEELLQIDDAAVRVLSDAFATTSEVTVAQ